MVKMLKDVKALYDKIVKGPPKVLFLKGDETTGIFADLLLSYVKKATDKQVGADSVIEIDWSLKGRIKSKGRTLSLVKEIIDLFNKLTKNLFILKIATVTPTSRQIDKTLFKLNIPLTASEVPKEVSGSPNPILRSEGNLARPAPKAVEYAIQPKPDWKKGMVEFIPMKNGDKTNEQVTLSDGNPITVSLGNQSKTFEPAANSPISTTIITEAAMEKHIRHVLDRALEEKKDILFTAKGTVIKGLDANFSKIFTNIFEKDYKEKFKRAEVRALGWKTEGDGQRIIGDYDDPKAVLVDFVAAKLLVTPPTQDLLVLTPYEHFSQELQTIFGAVQENGLDTSKPQKITVMRLTARKDRHYGGFSVTASDNGTLKINDQSHDVNKGDMIMVMKSDLDAVRLYGKQVAELALAKDADIIFTFDENHTYEKHIVAALKETLTSYQDKLDAKKINISYGAAGEGSSKLFAKNPSRETILASDNLFGDILSDMVPLMFGSPGLNDSYCSAEHCYVVETGGGGTAGDLLDSFPIEKVPFNPLPVINPWIYMGREIHKREGHEGWKKIADAMEEAVIETLQQGFHTPDLKLRPEIIKGEDTKVVGIEFVMRVASNFFDALGMEKEKQEVDKEINTFKEAETTSNPGAQKDLVKGILAQISEADIDVDGYYCVRDTNFAGLEGGGR